jgi:hypothetical protein
MNSVDAMPTLAVGMLDDTLSLHPITLVSFGMSHGNDHDFVRGFFIDYLKRISSHGTKSMDAV